MSTVQIWREYFDKRFGIAQGSAANEARARAGYQKARNIQRSQKLQTQGPSGSPTPSGPTGSGAGAAVPPPTGSGAGAAVGRPTRPSGSHNGIVNRPTGGGRP